MCVIMHAAESNADASLVRPVRGHVESTIVPHRADVVAEGVVSANVVVGRRNGHGNYVASLCIKMSENLIIKLDFIGTTRFTMYLPSAAVIKKTHLPVEDVSTETMVLKIRL